jgi:uncharacterized protein YihD (DUF1040 family)
MKTIPPLVCAASLALLPSSLDAAITAVVFDESINFTDNVGDFRKNSIDASSYAAAGGNTIDFSCFSITARTNIDRDDIDIFAASQTNAASDEIGVLIYDTPAGGRGLTTRNGVRNNYDDINDIYRNPPLNGSGGLTGAGNVDEQITFNFEDHCIVALNSVELDLRDFDHNNGGDPDGVRLWVEYDGGKRVLFNADGLLGTDMDTDKDSYVVEFSKFVGALDFQGNATDITDDSEIESFTIRGTGDQIWINGLQFDVVPEPNTFALGAVGMLMILRRRNRY